MTTTLNAGHFIGRGENTLILPVLARDEEGQPTTQESMFNYVRMSDGGCPQLDSVRSETAIIAEMVGKVAGSEKIDFSAFRKNENIQKAISDNIPGFEKLITMDNTKEEFQISRRIFHEPKFARADGEAVFTTISMPKILEGQFTMSSIRSEG